MSAFLPDNPITLARLLALLAVELVAGFGLQVLEPARLIRLRAWVLVAAATWITHWITFQSQPGFRMMALIGALFLGMKAVVGVSSRAMGQPTLSFPGWLAFTAWPGMKVEIFETRYSKLSGVKEFILKGLPCFVCGVALMAGSGWVYYQTGSVFAVTVLFFFGSSLMMHYGLFSIAAAFWRSKGFDANQLFLNPFPSENLGEFWGRRWNLAFHEMTAVAVYYPLKGKLGPSQALFVSFILSGLLHEIAISLPVKAGFGLPLLYFVLHWGLVALERFAAKRGFPLRGWTGRIWTFFWLIAPLPVLFHELFLKGVVWPLIGVTP